ncbi:preprotein translocase subunit SecA [Candidatus Uhrbacteria bacterium]|nr:preprotein translocase subunit SecA [Candidatus Uhrbacteria bacterium]
MSFLSKLFGDPNKRIVQSLTPLVEKINALEDTFATMTEDELKDQTARFKKELADGKTLDDLLPETFAVVRETAKRHLKQRHYDVQLIGGAVLHRGQITEMRTGEGKTLTATAPVYLNALTGRGVHVITVNDYLAKRDSVWMGKIYHALGLTVGCIQHEAAFLYDPSYTETIHETAEDGSVAGYKIEHTSLKPCTRKEAYAADITYGTNNEFGFDYLRDNLVADINQMSQRDLVYAIVDEVDSILIDEARTPLIISAPAEESADLYYRFADLVARLNVKEDYNIDEKMRAATLTEAGLKKMEEWLGMGNVYTAQSITIVHHIEQALRAQALFKKDKDYVVKDGEVIIVDEFTGRLMHGRRYSEGLHQAIEAKERVKIQRESRTYATVTFQNLFRMYEKLAGMTGTAATEAEEFSKIYKLEVVVIPTHRDNIRKDLQDRIYKTERGKYAAVVEEIKERHEKGQPVLVGTISIEKNEYLSKLLEREGIKHVLLNAKNHEKEGEIIAQAGRRGAVTIATNMAGRGVDILLGGNPPDQDEADRVREFGGLHVIGTERHESRRIDNQLRGRSGRQGDPGSTQFYVSMEDDLMRIFGSDRIKGLMDKLGMPEDVPIENTMVSKSLEEAQKKVEGHNFDTRKHLVEYDDVLNKHRDIIYHRRKAALRQFDDEMRKATALEKDEVLSEEPQEKTTLRDTILKMVEQEIEQVVIFHTASEDPKEWNLTEIYEVVNTIFPLPLEKRISFEGKETEGDKLAHATSRDAVIEYLNGLAVQEYAAFEERVANQIKQVYPDVNISLALRQIEKDILIRAIDGLWVEHLEAIDHLRHGIGLRGYGQHDPLVEYKKEAYRLFTELIAMIQKQVVYSIYKIGMVSDSTTPSSVLPKNASYSAPPKEGDGADQKVGLPAELSAKVGRNDPCPCGSGKKYKRCHGA